MKFCKRSGTGPGESICSQPYDIVEKSNLDEEAKTKEKEKILQFQKLPSLDNCFILLTPFQQFSQGSTVLLQLNMELSI